MGSGLALAIRNKFPIVYTEYLKNGTGKLLLGTLQLVKITDTLFVGNGYGQLNYGYDKKPYADPIAIDKFLHKAFSWCQLNNFELKTVKLGCDLGGLDWDRQIAPLFIKYEAEFETEAKIFYI